MSHRQNGQIKISQENPGISKLKNQQKCKEKVCEELILISDQQEKNKLPSKIKFTLNNKENL